MSSVNKAIILGNLGQDPESKSMANGNMVTNVSIATSNTWKDKTTGERKEKTEWHKVTFFGKQAEIASTYLTKGSKVYIEGRIETEKWQDKEGNDRYTTKIIAEQLKMVSDAKAKGQSSNSSSDANSYRQASSGSSSASGVMAMDDDIPF